MRRGGGGELQIAPAPHLGNTNRLLTALDREPRAHPISCSRTSAPSVFLRGLPGLVLSGRWLLVTSVRPP